jgi:putative glycosyltransferase (TIGR04372 family)
MRQDLSRYVSGYFGTQDIYRINRLWGDRPPILRLRTEDEAWAQSELERLGLRKDQWFVCVHVREGSYIPKNETIQSHRNASVANTIPAMEEIVRRGGVCVRMGDPGMTPLPSIPGVIDYARHSMKSGRLDVVLCAKARFFLGCTSGLSFISTTFGVPVAHANMIPVETLGIRYCDLSMPKLLWSRSLGRSLRFDEIFNSKMGGYFFTHQYLRANLQVEENSPEDLLELVSEMLDRCQGQFLETEEDTKLLEAYLSLFKPGHYSYGANSRVCLGFLRRHRDLLKPIDTEKPDIDHDHANHYQWNAATGTAR